MKALNWLVAMALVGVSGCAVDDGADLETEATEQANAQPDVWHANWNGASAVMWFTSELGGGHIDVWESGSGQTRVAYMNYAWHSVDPTSRECFTYVDWWTGQEQTYCHYTRFTYQYGWGEIPAADAHFTAGHAGLKTTIGPSFFTYGCTVDSYYMWSCTSGTGTGGTVDIRWRKDGVYSTFNSGTHHQTWGAYTFKTQGTFRSTSARASGTAFGLTLDNASGFFGSTRQTNITKSVSQTPMP